MRTTSVIAALALLGLAAPLAQADDGADLDNDVRLGMYYVHYGVSADDITGPYAPPGLNVRVEDLETLYFAYVRKLSTHFQVELAGGWPPLTRTVGRGPALLGSVPYNGQVIATARWLAPTLLLEYQFFDDTALLRPYFGVGVNYTDFYSRQSTAAGDAVTGGPTSVALPSSWGPAATVGVSYRIAPRWHAYASYSYSYVHSRLTADTAGLIHTTDINFNPRALVVSVGYSF
ncbi:MAG TPA: OmpW family outer membrane protein [Steroidobacteraceae bacterium]|nr:OmpW family outer membrane protein [Steroidobacteraceae bacterium]